MKTALITLLASLLFLNGYCQENKYEVRAKETRPVTVETLNRSKSLVDFIPGYPESWISSYVSVEILTSSDGIQHKATGPNQLLTAEQKNILSSAGLGANIIVNVIYKYDDLATNSVEKKQVNVSMTVVPETEAEYVGGREELNKYLRKNVSDRIPKEASAKLKQGMIVFTVNEEGEIVNAKISNTSGDPATDKLFVEAINNMPKWKPAQNSKGVKVRQGFEFSIVVGGC
jgi:TonB family protein